MMKSRQCRPAPLRHVPTSHCEPLSPPPPPHTHPNHFNPLSPDAHWQFTPLNLNPDSAKNVTVCVSLKAPCPTMEAFSPNGRSIEYALYDRWVAGAIFEF